MTELFRLLLNHGRLPAVSPPHRPTSPHCPPLPGPSNPVAQATCTACFPYAWECEFEILYGVGVSAAAEIVDLASEAGLIEKSGAYYSWNGERIAQGRDKACQFLNEHVFTPIR